MKATVTIFLFVLTNLLSAQKGQTKILMETSMGKITLMLYDETPLHRDNFIKLVKEHYYDGLLFHRVIKEFMIQGGDPDSRNAAPGKRLGEGGPDYTIPAEFHPALFHKKGALAAARLSDNINPKKESSGSQFYIVQGKIFTQEQLDMYEKRMGIKFSPEQRKAYTTTGGTPHLDGSYTVFGEVIEGLEIVDKIAAVQTDKNDRPIEDVKILSVKIIK